MNIITEKTNFCQAVVNLTNKKGKSYASRKYGVIFSSIKRWCKNIAEYDSR